MKLLLILLLTFYSGNDDNKRIRLLIPEEIKNSSLNDFLEKLKQAVLNKDTIFIIEHLDSKVHLGYGDYRGINDFRKLWHINDPKSLFWATIQRVLDLNGLLRDSIYVTPSFGNWPDNIPIWDHAAIIADSVDLHEQPRSDSKVVTKLNHELVIVIDNKSMPKYGTSEEEQENPFGGKDWYYVMTLDKKIEGFVYWKYIRSPMDIHLTIVFKGSKWTITQFFGGY